MKQVYYPYWEWEDYQYGMYDSVPDDEMITLIGLARDLLSDPTEFDKEASDMVFNWPISATHNLTNKSINRRAWIGQATCCFALNVPEILTKLAWTELTTEQRNEANNIAQKIIEDYERQNK